METRECAECGASLPTGVSDVFCPTCALRGVLGGDERSGEDQFLKSLGKELSQEQQFDQQWATTLLEQARAKLRQECAASGELKLYDRISLIDGQNESGVPYAVIAQELGMTVSAVKSAVSRLRARYRELVRQEVAHTVPSPSEIEEEIRHLLSVIGA